MGTKSRGRTYESDEEQYPPDPPPLLESEDPDAWFELNTKPTMTASRTKKASAGRTAASCLLRFFGSLYHHSGASDPKSGQFTPQHCLRRILAYWSQSSKPRSSS